MVPAPAMRARRTASGPTANAGEAIPPRASLKPASTDITESFRAARSAVGQISTDLEGLRRRAASMVKSAKRRGTK
jgi:hypothetical protein